MKRNLMIKLPEFPAEVTISKDWFALRDSLMEESDSFRDPVGPENDFHEAAELLHRITKAAKSLEELRKKNSKPLRDALDTLKKAASSALGPLDERKDSLKKKLCDCVLREMHSEAAEKKLGEKNRILTEEKRDILELLAEDLFGPSDTVIFNPSLPEEDGSSRLKSPFVSIRKKIDFEISDEDTLPRAFMSPDPGKIRDWIKKRSERLREFLEKREDFAARDIIPGTLIKLSPDVVSR